MTKESLSSLRREINADLAAIGADQLTGAEWEHWLDDEGWLRRTSIDAVAAAIVRRRSRQTPIAISTAPPETTAAPSLNEGLGQYQRWIWARSLLAAKSADEDEDVVAFRQKHLPTGHIALKDIPTWIDAHRFDDGASTYVTVLVSPTWKWGQEVNVRAGDVVSMKVEFVAYPDANQQWRCVAPTTRGSVLDQLRVLSSRLATRHAWQEAQASAFVLSGATPIAQVISTSLTHASTGNRVSITFDPDVPFEVIESAYRRGRRELLGPRARLPFIKAIQLVIHEAENPNTDVATLRGRWNRTYPGAAFGSVRAFRQALRDAQRRVAGVPR